MDDGWNGVLLPLRLWASTVPWWALVLPLLVALLLGLVLRRRWRHTPDDYDASADRFAPTATIPDEHRALLHYLQQAFLHEAVLYQPALSRFLMVRRCRDRRLAGTKLARLRVDFLVCAEDGQPWIAFDVDQRLRDGIAEANRLADEKRAMLQSAGIRLIRLRGSLHYAQPPSEMRARWEAAAAAPLAGAPRDVAPPTEWAKTRFQDLTGADIGPSRQRLATAAEDARRRAGGPAAARSDTWADVLKRA